MSDETELEASDCEACGMPLDFDSPDCSHNVGDHPDLALPFAENH